jgi:putative redox protein
MYADRKGWPLASVTVRLDHRRIHAKDCEECETKEGRIDRIERGLELAGPLKEQQRRRLLDEGSQLVRPLRRPGSTLGEEQNLA